MNRKQEVERVVDIRASQAYVKYMDGGFGFTLTQWVPDALLSSYYEERKNEATNLRTR